MQKIQQHELTAKLELLATKENSLEKHVFPNEFKTKQIDKNRFCVY